MTEHAQPLSDRTQTVRLTRILADTSIPLVVAAIGLPLIGQTYLAMFEPRPDVAHLGLSQRVLLHAIAAMPSILMSCALFALRRVLLEYEKGQFLSRTAIGSFRRVGQWAVTVLVIRLLVTPILLPAIRGERIVLFRGYDTFDISLLLFGALVALVGASFEAAALAIKAENDEII